MKNAGAVGCIIQSWLILCWGGPGLYINIKLPADTGQRHRHRGCIVVLQCYRTFRGRNPAQTQHLPTNQMIDCRTSHTENIFWQNNIYSYFPMKNMWCRWNCGGGAGQVQLSRDVIVYNNRKRLSCYKIFDKYLVAVTQTCVCIVIRMTHNGISEYL